MSRRVFKLALLQFKVGANKIENVDKAVAKIREAAAKGAQVICLPEIFNSPYGPQHFEQYSESVPDGETCTRLSNVVKETKCYLIGGSIPEKDSATGKLYNTNVCFDTSGSPVLKYRKCHLFDIDIPGKITFKESLTLSAGNEFKIFDTEFCKIGIGLCYDIRFNKMSTYYANAGCDLMVYPGAFNMTTGPAHWELLTRARATDHQTFFATCSPARDESSQGYIAYGHSTVADPWGAVIGQCGAGEETLLVDIDLNKCHEIRQAIPIRNQQRDDLY